MGRSKKIVNGEITNEKILGKLPKSSQIKSNIGNLDFDEDTIDGISILSFKTFDDLKEYYPIDKIQPNHLNEQPKKPEAKKRKIREKPDKNKTRSVKRKPVVKQPALGASNLTQFDKSESEAEEDQKNLLINIKTEESPPPSPLPEIPQSIGSTEAPPTTPGPGPTTPTIKSEGCSTSSGAVSSTTTTAPTTTATTLPTTPLPTTCGSGSPVYQPATSQHIPIPLGKVPVSHPASSVSSRLLTPPSAPPTQQSFYHALHRQHPVAASHPGLPFQIPHSHSQGKTTLQLQFNDQRSKHYNNNAICTTDGVQQLSPAELEMKLNAAKYDPRSYLLNGRFPNPAEMSRYRPANEYEKYLAATGLHRGVSRPLYPPSATPRPPLPATPGPRNHSMIPNRNEHSAAAAAAAAAAIGNSAGTAIQRQLNTMYKPAVKVPTPKIGGGPSSSAFKRLTEKKWNSIHVYIARMIYRIQQEAKDPQNVASANGSGGEPSARAFLSSGKREVTREYPQFGGAAGLHNLPPTPASPFPHGNNPFNPSLHQPHHNLGLRGLSTIHGLGNRFPPPSIRPPYSGLATAASSLYGHPGFDPLRHSLSSYGAGEMSRMEQERLHQLASIRSSELLSRTMYENSLRQHQAAAAQQREHEMQQAMSREMLLHFEGERRKLLASESQKLMPPASLPSNISDIYMRPQHLQAHLKYPGPGVGSSSHALGSFPNIFNRSLDPRARFSHLIPPPKGPE